jgi:hypothetical protein
MSSEPSLLPRKWFAAAAAISLLLAGLAAFLLFARRPPRVGIGIASPTTLSLRQRGEDGLLIPWGTTISGDLVRIEVAGVDPQRVKEIELLLSRDGAPPVRVDHTGNSADLKQLAPGRYRWSAVAHLASDVPMAYEPLRGDPLAADFIVSPSVLDLPPLQQRTLQGEATIETGGRTKGGAKLGTQFPSALPGAVLEVEATPAATAFNGRGVRRIQVQKGDVSTDFKGPDGAYHWRARLVAAANLQTEWQAFGGGPSGDFVIDAATPPDSSKENPKIPPENGTPDPSEKKPGDGNNTGNPVENGDPPGKGDPNQTNKNQDPKQDPKQPDKKQDPKQNPGADGKGKPGARAYSSGMGSGYRGPLPSRVKPLASLWHLALLRMALIFGGMIAALGVILITMRVIRGARRRPASVP